MPRVAVVFPTAWDRGQLARGRTTWAHDFTLELTEPTDADCPDDFDILGWLQQRVASDVGRFDGVMSSSDYPGATCAAALATALGLPACPPAASMAAAHKGLSRQQQRACVPDATPRFWVVDPDHLDPLPPDLPFPCFVKPAKGAFSMLARRVDDADALRAFLSSPEVVDYRHRYLGIYADLVRRFLGDDVDPRAFVVEELIGGRLVTVEGFVTGGEPRAIGVVDSLVDPRTRSFTGFEYPSRLPAAVQQRLCATACRIADHVGLRWTMFNVELMWDEAADRIRAVEINVRMCGQFADLFEKVDGVHGHRVALELACGRTPAVPRGGGRCAFAASYPLRVFAPTRVLRAPDAETCAAAEALAPGAMVWNEVVTGEELVDFSHDDGSSYRYAVVNVGAGHRAQLAEHRDRVVERLGYGLQPLPA